MIIKLRNFLDRNDREFAIITLEDRYGSVEVFIFSEVYERHRDIIYQGSFILVSGRLSRRSAEEQGKLTADWVMALDMGGAVGGGGGEVRLNSKQTDAKLLKQLQGTILRYRGNNPVYLRVVEPNGDYLLRSRELFAEPCDKLLEDLRERLGEAQVGLNYHPRSTAKGAGAGPLNRGMYALIHGGSEGKGNSRGGVSGINNQRRNRQAE